MKGFGEKNQSKREKNQNNHQKLNIDQLIKKAFELQVKGKKLEAAKLYQYLIKQGIKDYRVFSNYGAFLNEIGKFKEAELELKKAISLNPKYANAFYNLGFILKDLGRLKEADTHNQKALEVDPHLTDAYLSLSTMYSGETTLKWRNQLFSESLLKNKNKRELINIFFARSNILHKEGKYQESAGNLIKANNIKLRN